MITSEGIREIAEAIKNKISHGSYDLNGESFDTEIYNTSINGGQLIMYLYFDELVSGSLSNFKLVSTSGSTFAVKPEIIEKPGVKGLLVRFGFNVREDL